MKCNHPNLILGTTITKEHISPRNESDFTIEISANCSRCHRSFSVTSTKMINPVTGNPITLASLKIVEE